MMNRRSRNSLYSRHNATRSNTKFDSSRFCSDFSPTQCHIEFCVAAGKRNCPLSRYPSTFGAAHTFMTLAYMDIAYAIAWARDALRFAAPLDDLSGSFFEIRSDNVGLAKNVVEDKVLFIRDECSLEPAHARELSTRQQRWNETGAEKWLQRQQHPASVTHPAFWAAKRSLLTDRHTCQSLGPRRA